MRLRRLVDRGILHRLNRGQYVETREWNALDRDDRTVERTVIDLAARLDVKSAVAAIDRALATDRFHRVPPMTTKRQVLDTWERMLPFRGSVRARVLIDFGTELADSTSESASRVNIARNGFPEPILQRPFVIDGRSYYTDFYWEEFDAVGECDGDAKYVDPVLLGGRTTAEVVKAEKDREDAIRRRVKAFTRWDSAVAMRQHRLRERLLELGLAAGRGRIRLPQSDLTRAAPAARAARGARGAWRKAERDRPMADPFPKTRVRATTRISP